MSRVFDFGERWVAETEQKRADRGEGKENPRKPEEGSAVEDIFKQDFGLLNEDRLDGELAPIEEEKTRNGI